MSQSDFARIVPIRLLPGGIPQLVHTPSPPRHRTAIDLAATTKRVVGIFRRWRQRARDRAALAAIDDRLLDDTGLTRIEVMHAINKPFWKE